MGESFPQPPNPCTSVIPESFPYTFLCLAADWQHYILPGRHGWKPVLPSNVSQGEILNGEVCASRARRNGLGINLAGLLKVIFS